MHEKPGKLVCPTYLLFATANLEPGRAEVPLAHAAKQLYCTLHVYTAVPYNPN
jgi:hypothetical protein